MKRTIAILRYILSIHVFALLAMTLVRVVFYVVNNGMIGNIEGKTDMFFKAMIKGVWFDNTMSCYVIMLPLFVLLLFSIFDKIPRIGVKIFNVYFIVLYSILIGFAIADIPFFAYNQAHLGGSVFHWLAFGGQTAAMIFQEKSYYFYMILFIVLVAAIAFTISFFSRRLLNKKFERENQKRYAVSISLSLIALLLCFISIRGSLDRYPLRVSDAYFCNNSVFNQMGLNPTFFFVKSCSCYFKKHNFLNGIMDEKEAILFAQKQLGTNGLAGSSPIYRQIDAVGEPNNLNVVVVLMESFSSDFLKYEFKGKTLTPYIHSLIDKSYYFNNFYSAGIHTNNGIGATLSGFPSLFGKPTLNVDVDHYDGLPMQLQKVGYETLFFITGNAAYDYMNSFLLENGIGKVYSQPDYPSDKVVNNFGVRDDYIFEYGIPRLTEINRSGKPFFATFLTVTNHPPFIVPEGFKDKGKDDPQRMIAYVDNSIKIFMENASKEPWFDNTVFVFLGDHGRAWDENIYEMPLAYNHIPLIIYSPSFRDAPKRCEQFGGQIDVFPTVMGLLNRSYDNNSLGIDLFREKRPCIFFASDNHLGCINDNFFYQYNIDTKSEGLFEYRDNKTKNLSDIYPAVRDSLKMYGTSMMMTADYMLRNKLMRIEK